MKSLIKLQRKLLRRKYGFLALIFLKVVAPNGTNLDALKKWHSSLIRIKTFSDLYAKTVIYFVVFSGVMYAVIRYIFTFFSLEEVLLIAFGWIQKIQTAVHF